MQVLEPRHLTGDRERQIARQIRDEQWALMMHLAAGGVVRLCWFQFALIAPGSHILAAGLHPVHGTELVRWIKKHRQWWQITRRASEPSTVRLSLTAVGRHALRNKGRYDMEPVEGGHGDGRWYAVPAGAVETERLIAGVA